MNWWKLYTRYLAIIFLVASPIVWAYRMEQPQAIFRWDCPSFSRLNHYLNELWNITNGRYALDTITFDPTGTRQGTRGEMVQATFNGRKHFCINQSDSAIGSPGTDWQCIDIETAEVVVNKATGCAVIENLAAADDNIPLGSYNSGIAVRTLWCTCSGTCTTPAQISLETGSGVPLSHPIPTCSAIGVAPDEVGISSSGSLDARESLRFDVDNTPTPETDTYEICWSYTSD